MNAPTTGTVTVTGLILAGGASRRMGSPKALLDVEGETFLDRLIRLFSHAVTSIIVVVGHQEATIRAGSRRASEVTFVTNPDPERGQLSSLQCGLAVVPPGTDGVIFTPVDYPSVQLSTVVRVVTEFKKNSQSAFVVVPQYAGRRGHPVCIASGLIPRFLDLPPASQAREVIRENYGRTLLVDVQDPGILRDVDNREDYGKLLARNFEEDGSASEPQS